MFHVELEDYQLEGASSLAVNRRLLLVVPVGLGKTLTALKGFHILKQRHPSLMCYVLCPKNALTSWEEDLNKTDFNWKVYGDAFRTSVDIEVYPQSRSEELLSVIINNQRMNGGRNFVLILDECDTYVNPKTTLYQRVEALVKGSAYTWGLTATPLSNRLFNTYYFMKLVLHNKFPFGGYYEFRDQYMEGREKKIGRGRTIWECTRHKNMHHLRERLKEVSFQVTVVRDVRFKHFEVDLSSCEELRYRDAAIGVLENPSSAGSLLHGLQLIIDGVGEEDISSKERFFQDRLLPQLISRGNPFLLYVTYKDVLQRMRQLLARNGVDFRAITGDTPHSERAEIKDWQRQGGPRAILMTKAGSRGINLQFSETMVMYNLPFDIRDMVQLLGRQCRKGSPFSANYVVILGAKNTIDTYKMHNLTVMTDVLLKVLSGESVLPKDTETISRNDLIKERRRLLWRK